MRITFGHALVAITALTAALIPISTGAANAAPADKPKPPAAVSAHHGHDAPNVVPIHHAVPPRTTTLTTQIRGASIRSLASTDRRSRTVHTLHGKGSTVEVTCYLLGERVSGDRTWYRTASPRIGYISGAELAIRHEPALHVQACSLNAVKR